LRRSDKDLIMPSDLLLTHWPLFGLRVTTPRLELRYPTDDDIAVIAERSAVDGIHDPEFMPFTIEWTDVESPLQQRNSLLHHWGNRASWTPQSWNCNFAVVVDGTIVGIQGAGADNFSILHSVLTGSFLFLPDQGKGIGSEMRAAILHLVFAGLGAQQALSAAWSDNAQSHGVSAKLGYERVGSRMSVSRGAAREMINLRLERAVWQAQARTDIVIEGLEPCLNLFGVPAASE
jgi:RimJ/RimL family protein N-acetyltransferase